MCVCVCVCVCMYICLYASVDGRLFHMLRVRMKHILYYMYMYIYICIYDIDIIYIAHKKAPRLDFFCAQYLYLCIYINIYICIYISVDGRLFHMLRMRMKHILYFQVQKFKIMNLIVRMALIQSVLSSIQALVYAALSY